MDTSVGVERELDKVLNKFKGIREHSSKSIQDLIDEVERIRNELNQVPADSTPNAQQCRMLNECMKKLKDVIMKLAVDHRDLHGTVSKVGKAIDRNFISDFGATSNDEVFEGPIKSRLLNQLLCEHFYRQGMLEIGEELVKESGLEVEQSKKEPFYEMNSTLEALKKRNLEPALLWTQANREQLRQQNSSLEFKLHRLKFIELLRTGKDQQGEAVNYARNNFPQFADQHEKDIQVLMGSLLFLNDKGIELSPYQYLLDPLHWIEICDVFTRDACALLGLPVESSLTVCINAGCIALPSLLNIKQVMQQRQVHGVWSSRDELPIEIDLGKEYRYHSVFACPILRQQSTENNPPMRLVCGHVVSRDALNKLANGNKLKCPYCPLEQNPLEARVIHF